MRRNPDFLTIHVSVDGNSTMPTPDDDSSEITFPHHDLGDRLSGLVELEVADEVAGHTSGRS